MTISHLLEFLPLIAEFAIESAEVVIPAFESLEQKYSIPAEEIDALVESVSTALGLALGRAIVNTVPLGP